MLISTLRTKLRAVIQDTSKSSFESFIASGTTFTIAQENADAVTSVTVKGNTSGVSYSYYVESQIVTLTDASVADGDAVVIYYTYKKYSDTELNDYIRSAIFWMDVFNYLPHFDISSGDEEIYPIPYPKEQNLIIIVASILINPDWMEYRTATVTIRYPRTQTKEEKIESIITKFMFSRIGIAEIINL